MGWTESQGVDKAADLIIFKARTAPRHEVADRPDAAGSLAGRGPTQKEEPHPGGFGWGSFVVQEAKWEVT